MNEAHEELARNIVKKMADKFMTIEDNVYHADRLFMASGVVTHALAKYESGEMPQAQLHQYLLALDKYLNKQLDIFWEDGILKVMQEKNVRTDEIRKAAMTSLQDAFKIMTQRTPGNPDNERGE
jgi:hypothetical protein